uniref:Astacin domain-containing protein n=1 Tax=Parastrongyloides trichosuri TaxID=131310 RepID=A0A0N5A738_PARTI
MTMISKILLLLFLLFQSFLYLICIPYLPQMTDKEKVTDKKSFRIAKQQIYLWNNINQNEKTTIIGAFKQIERRTCLRFKILNYKPWNYPENIRSNMSYGIIMKSNKFYGYIDKEVGNKSLRSTIYLSNRGLHHLNKNIARGIIMDQILKYMGFKEEYLRPDASSYIKEFRPYPKKRFVQFSDEQLDWPFDPESVTMPYDSPKYMKPTIYCPGRQQKTFGAGQREGLLTIWDAVKINAMYCPNRVINVDRRKGPCVIARKNLSMSKLRHKGVVTYHKGETLTNGILKRQ